MTTTTGPRWGSLVKVDRVVEFCEDAFPLYKKEGEWSGM